MIDMTNIYPSHKKHSKTLLFVRNTPYNLEQIKEKFGVDNNKALHSIEKTNESLYV